MARLPEWVSIFFINQNCPDCQRKLTERDLHGYRLARDPQNANMPLSKVSFRCGCCGRHIVQEMWLVAHDGTAIPSTRADAPQEPITDQEHRSFLIMLQQIEFYPESKSWQWLLRHLLPAKSEAIDSPVDDEQEDVTDLP